MSLADYEPVIGLEIHVQLSTRTKMFCGCELSFGDPPNVHTCPICLGLPGTLPAVNGTAVKYGVMLGLAFGCEIAERSQFHRKNYFYPDLSKGYQISQYDVPLCRDGRLGEVGIHRVHVEEDAAKLVHLGESGRIHGADRSFVDFNRGGTPLVEIVTEPDLHSAEHAREWLGLLRTTVRALGVSDVDMSQGSLRCDANVSLRPRGSTAFGTRTELKNMNSFRFLQDGIQAELRRQAEVLDAGREIVQQTMHFDPGSGELTPLRSKEEAHDYRYFPEPDLMALAVSAELLEAARAELPELPADRAARFERELELPAERARELAYRSELADYFEAAVAADGGAAEARAAGEAGAAGAITLVNWIPQLVERIGSDADPAESRVSAEAFARVVELVSARRISRDAGRQVLSALVEDGGDPDAIVAREGLAALSGEDSGLEQIVAAAIAAEGEAAEKLRGGNTKAIGPLVGYVMRETKGRADGGEVTDLIRRQLGL